MAAGILHYGFGIPAITPAYYLKVDQQVITYKKPEHIVLMPSVHPVIMISSAPAPPPPPLPPPKPHTVMKIHFAFNSYYVPYKDRLKLEKLSRNKQYILIGGADRIGTYRYNMWLSNKRALEVKYFMKKDGLKVIRAKGIGYTKCHTYFRPDRKCRVVNILAK